MAISTSAGLSGHTALVFDGGLPIAAAVTRGLQGAGARVERPDAAFDVMAEASWSTLLQRCGDIDRVVIGPAATTSGGLDDLSLATFRAAETAHIVRPWLILKHMLPVLARHTSAAIAVVIPRAGLKPLPGRIADCAAFGALRSMFRSAALECGQIAPGVRVNAVIAGDGVPDADVVAGVLHVLSADADFMTGAELDLGGP